MTETTLVFYIRIAYSPLLCRRAARRGWTHGGLKQQLLHQGGDACSLKRRSERNIFHKYYAEDDDDYDSIGESFTLRACVCVLFVPLCCVV